MSNKQSQLIFKHIEDSRRNMIQFMADIIRVPAIGPMSGGEGEQEKENNVMSVFPILAKTLSEPPCNLEPWLTKRFTKNSISALPVLIIRSQALNLRSESPENQGSTCFPGRKYSISIVRTKFSPVPVLFPYYWSL